MQTYNETSGYSCETQLLVTLHDFMKAYDAGLQTDVAILDFSKAFDTVPHKKLLLQMDSWFNDVSILCLSRCFIICLHIICSRSLHGTNVSDTGL
jgi:hypothetical protein